MSAHVLCFSLSVQENAMRNAVQSFMQDDRLILVLFNVLEFGPYRERLGGCVVNTETWSVEAIPFLHDFMMKLLISPECIVYKALHHWAFYVLALDGMQLRKRAADQDALLSLCTGGSTIAFAILASSWNYSITIRTVRHYAQTVAYK